MGVLNPFVFAKHGKSIRTNGRQDDTQLDNVKSALISTNEFPTDPALYEIAIVGGKIYQWFDTGGGLAWEEIGGSTSGSDPTKADKVVGATDGNLAALNSTGNLTDSLYSVIDFQPVISPHVTQTLIVDNNRTDSYTPDGTDLRPYKTIADAIVKANTFGSPGIIQLKSGYYVEDFTLPTEWGLYGEGLQTLINGDITTGLGNKSMGRFGHESGTFLVNDITTIDQYIGAQSVVDIAPGTTAFMNDSVVGLDEPDQVGLVMRGNQIQMSNCQIRAGDSSVITQTNGILWVFDIQIANDSASDPAIDSQTGAVICSSGIIFNSGGGLAASLDNGAGSGGPPNVFLNTIDVGGFDCGSAVTYIDGPPLEEVPGGPVSPVGTALKNRLFKWITTPTTNQIHVDADNGDDTFGDGTLSKPFEHILDAIDHINANMPGTKGMIVLSPGDYNEIGSINLPAWWGIEGHSATTTTIYTDVLGSSGGTGFEFNHVKNVNIPNHSVEVIESMLIEGCYLNKLEMGLGSIQCLLYNTSVYDWFNPGLRISQADGYLAAYNSFIYSAAGLDFIVYDQTGGSALLFQTWVSGETPTAPIISSTDSSLYLRIEGGEVTNWGGGPAITINNTATGSSPNMLRDFHQYGGIGCSTSPTFVDGVLNLNGSITGSALIYNRPKTSDGTDGITQTINITDQGGTIHNMTFTEGILTNYTTS